MTQQERERRAAGYGPQSYAKQIWHVIKYAIRQRAGTAKALRRRTHRYDEQDKH